MERTRRQLFGLAAGALLFAAGCGGSDSDDTSSPAAGSTADGAQVIAPGVRVVSATVGAAIQADPPDDLVILDVRTPEEFAEGHLEGAVMVDFYEADFTDRLAELDPDVPYLLYCRSGNRSGQTAELMKELGFSDVADVDGGILAWAASDLPVIGS